MLYLLKQNNGKLTLQGKEFGTITTHDGKIEVALTGSPIAMQEGNELRIESSHCTETSAMVGCLVAERSQSRLLMTFVALKENSELPVGNAVILVKSVDFATKTVVIQIMARDPIAMLSGEKLHVTLERIEKERFGEAQALIGILKKP
ncbi:MAG: hypothetical protein EXS60_01935 [Candidatus Pacebacteria bacterium]|nr:hypothetical protein [Candidatus Paceibacterota bacterium]